MKLIINIFRSFIYMILSFVFIGLSYKGLNMFCFIVFNGFGSVKNSMNTFLFWVLFFLIGIFIFLTLWIVFKLLIILVNTFITKICPYPKLGEWFVNFNVLLSLVYYIYSVWSINYNSSGVMVCILVSIMGITLGRLITENTTKIFIEREYSQYKTSPYEKIIEEIKNDNDIS